MTDYLFANPSFLSGVARVLDLWGSFDEYNTSKTPLEADAKALFADWRAVGGDLKSAINAYEEIEADNLKTTLKSNSEIVDPSKIDDKGMIFTFEGEGQEYNFEPRIKVVGVGGGGGNAVRTMFNQGIAGVELIVANTDAQALKASPVPLRIQLGKHFSGGIGAGGKPEIGMVAAIENEDDVRAHLKDANMVFVVAGMGGGTGTGAAPIIASIARELGALTVAVVTKPFMFEGKHKCLLADAGINELRKNVDTLIIIPNQQLLGFVDKKSPATAAFQKADGVLCGAVKGISDIITGVGGINVDFADVKTVMSQKGMALLGVGMGSGDMRAIEAAQNAINSPLLEDSSIEGARGLLINITGGPEFSLHEINDVINHIATHADPEADIKFGFAVDESMGEKVSVTMIATGFRAAEDTLKWGNIEGMVRVERIPRSGGGVGGQQVERMQMRRSQLKAVSSDINYLDENLDIPSFMKRQTTDQRKLNHEAGALGARPPDGVNDTSGESRVLEEKSDVSSPDSTKLRFRVEGKIL